MWLSILVTPTYPRVFHPCSLVQRFPLPRFPPLQSGAAFFTPAFSVAPWLSHSFRVHRFRFRPGLRSGPRWGSLQRSPRPPIWIKGALVLRGSGGEERREGEKGGDGKRGAGGERRGEKGRGRERREGERRRRDRSPFRKFLDPPMTTVTSEFPDHAHTSIRSGKYGVNSSVSASTPRSGGETGKAGGDRAP